MSQPLSYSILNTSRRPRLASITRENSDRLFKTENWSKGGWQRMVERAHTKENKNKREGMRDRLKSWVPGNNKVLGIKLNIMVKCCREVQRHKTAAVTAVAAIEVLSADTQVCAHLTSQRLQSSTVSPFSSCPIVCPNTMKYGSSTGLSFPLLYFCKKQNVSFYQNA